MNRPARLLPVLALVVTLAGCAAGPVEVATPTTTPTPTAEAKPQGTRDNPFPVGTAAKHSQESVWTYTIGETDTDAWPEISGANEFNAPAEAANTYITVPVHFTLDDAPQVADGADAWGSFDISYVTTTGNSYEGSTCALVLPSPGALHEIGTMFGGAQADFLGCAQVPTTEISGGVWRVYSLIASDSVFFVGAP